MKKRNRILRTMAALLCVCMLLTAEVAPAVALTWSDVNELKDQAGDLDEKKKDLEEKLSALASDKSKALERKRLIDQKVAVLVTQINNVEAQIVQYQGLITQTQAELEEAERKEEAQYELFCQRVRAMEENGKVSYWSVLFKAADFTDLLSRLDFVNEVMEYDQGVIQELQNLQTEITAKKTDLETQMQGEKDAKSALVSQKSELDAQRTEANALVKEIQNNEAEYKDAKDAIEAEEESIQRKIVQMSKELAAKEAAANGKPNNAALGGYIWPVNSRRITSTFGGRASPGGIGSTNHKGLDIGGVGYNSEIYAAKAGTVIVSQYSSSYGNYVVVSHGSGNTTLYGHMSSRKVDVGQHVNQGDVLGITGSTGNSTGPHLHFEITENGSRINPQKYLK